MKIISQLSLFDDTFEENLGDLFRLQTFHPKHHDKRISRIPLKTDKRIFTCVARNSKKWKRLYRKRSGIERMNGRIDRDFKFEKHTIRGINKMKMFLKQHSLLNLHM